ncbi:uncharacterized protein VTP21DRAFT_7554 [Calcarisporiella thermophila]|uniref:uncharacterized protein n=1 Tax=Calcarisporiella thermophila TaxID=911321 RepID=UPI0037428656
MHGLQDSQPSKGEPILPFPSPPIDSETCHRITLSSVDSLPPPLSLRTSDTSLASSTVSATISIVIPSSITSVHLRDPLATSIVFAEDWLDNPPLSPSILTADPFFNDYQDEEKLPKGLNKEEERENEEKKKEKEEEEEIDVCKSVRAAYENAEKVKDMAMPDVDRYGFLKTGDTPNTDESDTRVKEKEIRRTMKWNQMVEYKLREEGQIHLFKLTPKFASRVFKGIPDCWRGEAWYYMLVRTDTPSPEEKTLFGTYHVLLNLPSSHESLIDADIRIARNTMHRHSMFLPRYGPGQRHLFNVLRAFSNYDIEVGFCQGMTPIAAMLLLYYVEERAFAMMTHLFHRYNLHSMFVPGFPLLIESFYIQEGLLRRYAPKVAKRLNGFKITSSAYATRWFITLFTGDVVPHSTLLRIWDVLMLQGFDILYFVAVGLLKMHQGKS